MKECSPYRFPSLVLAVLLLASLSAVPAGGQLPSKPSTPGLVPGTAPPGAVPRSPAKPSPAAPVPGIPQGPQIRAFSGPERFVFGESFRLTWQVDPGPSGSPISSVGLYRGESVLAGPLPAAGSRDERPVSYPVGAAALEYTLKARDRGGAESSRSIRVQILSAQYALHQLTVTLQSEPREFRRGDPFQLKVILGAGVWPMTGLNIRVTNGSRSVGDLSGLMVRGPVNPPVMVRDEGFTGENPEYTVDIEYRGEHLEKKFRIATVPYYTLTPASR